MARLKLEMPEKCIGTYSIPVRISDINYGNHLGNDSVVSVIHEARVQFLNQIQCTEMDVFGTSLIMSGLQVAFRNEAYYGDTLEVKMYAGEISEAWFDLFYAVATKRNEATVIVANAKTTMACFNYQKKKIELVPAQLRSILSGA